MLANLSHAISAPAEGHNFVARLFLRALGLIYLAAFWSLAVQIEGLVGSGGILPLAELLAQAEGRYGALAWLHLPTLFWLAPHDWALVAACWLGVALSVLLLFARFERTALIGLFILYLSLQQAGQLFLNFQWDYLLLEAGFLAIFIPGGMNRITLFLFHWLLFRLRFLSGSSKLVSDDPTWANLTALKHYFETQPLPHMGSWYAHHLPEWLLRGGAGFTLFAELIVPFMIFLPRPFRIFAALTTILLQLAIIATSNHNFFNLLTIALCLLVLDDRFFGRDEQRTLAERALHKPGPGIHFKGVTSLFAGVIILSASLPAIAGLFGAPIGGVIGEWSDRARNWGLGNIYHVFPVMQTERRELVIEGSRDGEEWHAYRFRYKPETLERPPPFIVPHQPRLDWMIWFAPAQSSMAMYWFDRFAWRLRQNSPKVTGLLEHNPFADEPPNYLRVEEYSYRFTTPLERRESGDWWIKEYLGPFPSPTPRNP